MAGNRLVELTIRVGLAAMLGAQAGCFALRPVAGSVTPDLGATIAVDINDAGRSALGREMVTEIAQIEGRLTGKDSTEIELAVTMVRLLRGGEQVWKGERVRIRTDYVSRVYEKHFSASRTMMAGVTGASVVAYFATKALIGSGLGDTKVPSDSSPGDMFRRPARP